MESNDRAALAVLVACIVVSCAVAATVIAGLADFVG